MKPQPRQQCHILTTVRLRGLTAWSNGNVVSFWLPADHINPLIRLVSVSTLSEAHEMLSPAVLQEQAL